MKQTSFKMKYIYLLFMFSFCFSSNTEAQAFLIDTTFNLNYNFYAPWCDPNPAVYGLNYEPDGKLMIYGDFFDGSTIADVLRFYENGSLDTSWHFLGGNYILFLEQLNNNYFLEGVNSLWKVNYNGLATDTAWNNKLAKVNCYGSYYYPYIFTDASMLVGSDPCNTAKCLMKFMPDGTIDTNFRHTTNNVVFGITKYSSDKLLLYGGGQYGFTKYDTTSANVMCKIDTLGNLDTTFKSIFTSGSSNPQPYYIQNDGKIIVVGGFYINNNNQFHSLIRLNPDGSLDSTFNNINSVAYPDYVNCVCPTTDGGYLIGGGFSNYQGYSRNNIVKTDLNGFIDTTYFNGEGIDSTYLVGFTPYVSSIKQGTNDTYYVMGFFTHYNGVHVYPIIRLKGISAGINDIKQEKGEVKVYPNPAKETITIAFDQAISNDGIIEIWSLLGNKLLSNIIPKGYIEQKVNVNRLTSGVYFYIIKINNDKFSSGKLIILNK